MKDTRLKGIVYIALSAAFYGSYGVWSKLMSGTFSEFNQAWIRAVMLLIILVPFGLLHKSYKKIKRIHWKWFILISVIGGLNQAPYYWGFEHLSVGTATLLFYISLTLGTYMLGFVFFKEKLAGVKISSLILGLIGLGIIYSFSLSNSQVIPALSTMIAGIMGAVFVVFSKKISSHYSETQIITLLLVCVLIGNGMFSVLFKESFPDIRFSKAWCAQIGYSISYLIANIAVIAGFRYLQPSIGGIIGLLEVVFAAILGILLFNEILSSELVIGSILILLASGLSDLYSLIKKYLSN